MNIQIINQNRQSGYANKNVNFCSTINPKNLAENMQGELRRIYHSGYWHGKSNQIEPHDKTLTFGVLQLEVVFSECIDAIDAGAEKIVGVMKKLYKTAVDTGYQGKLSEGYKEATRTRGLIADVFEQSNCPNVAAELRKSANDNLPTDY